MLAYIGSLPGNLSFHCNKFVQQNDLGNKKSGFAAR
jgi:hypothetical protein